MRFPYAVVCMLFAFPATADDDVTPRRPISTFRRATRLLATISGRREYTDPGEKFENVTLILFQPVGEAGGQAAVQLIDSKTQREVSERQYFLGLRGIYSNRNPHAAIGEEIALEGDEEEDAGRAARLGRQV